MGWNGSDNRGKSATPTNATPRKIAPTKNWYLRGLFAGLFVVTASVFVSWVIFIRENKASDSQTPKPNQKKVLSVVKSNGLAKKAEQPKPNYAVSTNSPKWVAAKGLDPTLFPYKDGRKVIASRTNEFDQIIDICIMPSGRSRKVVRNARQPVFKHATDQYIAAVLAGDNSSELPPIPIADCMEDTFLESLNTPIVIDPNDSDELKETKQRVIEAREVIDEELRKGRSLKSILEDHLALRKRNAELREQAEEIVRESAKAGDAEITEQSVKKVNDWLREQGVSEISVNNKHLRQLMKKGGNTTTSKE